MPVASTEDGAEALEELLPLLRRELRRRGAVAVHGDRRTGLRGGGLRGAPARGARASTRAEALAARGARPGSTRGRGGVRASWAVESRGRSEAGSAQDRGALSESATATGRRIRAVQVRLWLVPPVEHQRRVEAGRGRRRQVGVHAVAHHERRPSPEPVERREQQLRLGLPTISALRSLAASTAARIAPVPGQRPSGWG